MRQTHIQKTKNDTIVSHSEQTKNMKNKSNKNRRWAINSYNTTTSIVQFYFIYSYRDRTMTDFLCKSVSYWGNWKWWPRKFRSLYDTECQSSARRRTTICPAFFHFALFILITRSGFFERYTMLSVSGKSESVNERTYTDQ